MSKERHDLFEELSDLGAAIAQECEEKKWGRRH